MCRSHDSRLQPIPTMDPYWSCIICDTITIPRSHESHYINFTTHADCATTPWCVDDIIHVNNNLTIHGWHYKAWWWVMLPLQQQYCSLDSSQDEPFMWKGIRWNKTTRVVWHFWKKECSLEKMDYIKKFKNLGSVNNVPKDPLEVDRVLWNHNSITDHQSVHLLIVQIHCVSAAMWPWCQ